MSLEVNLPLEEALDLELADAGRVLFPRSETGIKRAMVEQYWPKRDV